VRRAVSKSTISHHSGAYKGETFSAYINEEVFARQLVERFSARVPKGLPKKNLATFLEYRTKSRYGAPAMLPLIVENTAVIFMKFYSKPSNEIRLRWIQKISALVVTHCPDPAKQLIAAVPSKAYECAQNSNLDTAPQIAILSGSKDIAVALLDRGASPWNKTFVFSPPMELALGGVDLDIPRHITKCAGITDEYLSKKNRSRIVNQVIVTALTLNTALGTAAAIHLLEWHVNHLYRPFAVQCGDMFTRAVAEGVLPFIGSLLDLGWAKALMERYLQIVIGSLKVNDKASSILRVCFEKKFVSSSTKFRQRPDDASHCLLYCAIYADSPRLVKTVLAHDVSRASSQGAATLIRTAIEKNNLSDI